MGNTMSSRKGSAACAGPCFGSLRRPAKPIFPAASRARNFKLIIPTTAEDTYGSGQILAQRLDVHVCRKARYA